MATGVRIISNNLLGKTVTVTFTPYSGSTIDLGTQTIPFNYISASPYGVYNIFVLEYQYGYTLVVPPPPPLQPSYTETVKLTYTGATLSETWGAFTTNFIQSQGYMADDIIYAEGICSDDVDGPTFSGIDNIGQFPESMNSFLGPFMSGGLAGYPFVGSVGLGAWASHVTNSGTLFISNTPHIGISINNDIGSVYRRGQGSYLSNTCGAVAGACNWVVTTGLSEAPQLSAWTGNYEFYKLLEILWPFCSELTGKTYSEQMVFATEKIKNDARDYIYNNLPSAVTANTSNDVFFCTGTFINTDDGYESYVEVSEFLRYNNTTNDWTDLTSEYLSGLNG